MNILSRKERSITCWGTSILYVCSIHNLCPKLYNNPDMFHMHEEMGPQYYFESTMVNSRGLNQPLHHPLPSLQLILPQFVSSIPTSLLIIQDNFSFFFILSQQSKDKAKFINVTYVISASWQTRTLFMQGDAAFIVFSSILFKIW